MIAAILLSLLGAVLGGGIGLAYLARRRARRQTVGSLRILRAAAGSASTRRLVPRLKHRVSLLLVLLALLALVAGLSADGCAGGPTGRVLLVVDGGAGMARQTPGGATLMQTARAELSSSLPSAGAASVAVVRAGETPSVPVGLTADVSLALDALDTFEPGGRADVVEALRLADRLCADPERDRLLLVTDALPELPQTRCPVQRLALASPDPNVGISTLVARPTDGMGLIEAVVGVAGDRPAASTVEVELRLDDRVVDAFFVSLPAGGSATSVRRFVGPGEVLEARLVGDGGSTERDDRAEVRISRIAPTRVALVTDRPDGLLATALQLHPAATVRIVSPDEAEALDDVDLSVLEVPAKPPQAGHVVLLGEAVRAAGLEEEEALRGPSITRWAFDDPLLRYVDLDDLVLRSAFPLSVPGSGSSLIEADGRPIAVRGELSGRPMVAFGFGVAESDLALRVDFLHLWANLIDWASPEEVRRERIQHDPGAAEMGGDPGVLAEVDRLPTTGARGWPYWMWGVILAIALLVLEAIVAFFRPFRRTSLVRRAATYGIRVGVLGVLAISLLGLAWVLPGGEPSVVFVVDRSASVGERGLSLAESQVQELRGDLPAGIQTELVFVDHGAEVMEGAAWPEGVREDPVAASDLGAGVQTGLALIDDASGGRIVLLTDGGDTRGALSEAMAQAAQRGIAVDVLPLPEAEGDPALLGLELNADVIRPGETVQGTVSLRGSSSVERGRLRVEIDNAVVYDEAVSLEASRTRASFEAELPDADRPGARRLSVRLLPEGDDPEPGNNQRTAGLTVGEPPTVLAVVRDPKEVEAIRRAVEAEGMTVVVRTPADAFPNDLRQADVLVLGDVPVASEEPGEAVLSPGFLEAIRPWVSEGGGLITLGGDRNYELGGWSDTALSAVLPLDLSAKAEDLEPAVTLVQILDNSASMGDWSGYQTKMALANEGAVASMRLLRPRDTLSVLAVNTNVERVVPPQAVTDPLRLSASIRSIKPGGGGIYTYTSLMAAEGILKRSGTPLKHVVLYADAQDAEEMVRGIPFGFGPGPTAFEVAKRIRRQGGSVSVIALGDPRDQHVGFLQDVARLGGGRFRITREPNELRALFVEETREVVRTVIHDTAFRPQVVTEHETLREVPVDQAPDLLGYVEVEARPTADVILKGPEERPILVTWQYGLGHVASWSTDLGPRWGSRWVDWDAYPRLVVQQVRWALRPPLARGAGIEVVPHHAGMGIVVTRFDDEGLALQDQGLKAHLVQGSEKRPIELRPTVPGRWEGQAGAEPGAAYTVVLSDAVSGEPIARQAIVVPEGPEREIGGREALPELAESSGGEFSPDGIGETSIGVGTAQALGWWLALLGLVLLPLDAWVRVPVRG